MDTVHRGKSLGVFVEYLKILGSQDNVDFFVETTEADDCGRTKLFTVKTLIHTVGIDYTGHTAAEGLRALT